MLKYFQENNSGGDIATLFWHTVKNVGEKAWNSFESCVTLKIHMHFHLYQTNARCFDISNILNYHQDKRGETMLY